MSDVERAGAVARATAERRARTGWTPQRTVAEALDAARTPQEFGAVIGGLFAALERAMDEEDDK